MEERGPQDFDRAWDPIARQERAEIEERRRCLYGIFGSGGAEEADFRHHASRILSALCVAGYHDTLAVILRGFGYDEHQILAHIKRYHLKRGLTVGCAWDALRAANIKPDPQAVIAALEEIDENHRGGRDDVPF